MKTIIITGASGGLGSVVTQKILDAGHQVIATVSSEAGKEALGHRPGLQTEILDLSQEDAVESFVARMVGQFKKIDAAFLLAGGFAMGDIAATDGDALHKMYKINFETAFYMSRFVFAHMLAQKDGRIVFIGARPAFTPADGKSMVAYGLAKSQLFTLSEYLNEAAKGTAVTSAVIVPSTIDTEVNRRAMPDADPANWVSPAQMADLLSFLISDASVALREPVLKLYNKS